jgi:hypothetical protein
VQLCMRRGACVVDEGGVCCGCKSNVLWMWGGDIKMIMAWKG